MFINRRRDMPLQEAFFAGLPELEDRLHERDDLIAALDVTLLAQKMHEPIAPLAQLVDAGGDLTQPALGADVVEKNRQQPGELFNQVIDGADPAVQQLRDIAREEVDVPQEYPAQRKVHDERRQQAG